VRPADLVRSIRALLGSAEPEAREIEARSAQAEEGAGRGGSR
jgi:hypothetical protein